METTLRPYLGTQCKMMLPVRGVRVHPWCIAYILVGQTNTVLQSTTHLPSFSSKGNKTLLCCLWNFSPLWKWGMNNNPFLIPNLAIKWYLIMKEAHSLDVPQNEMLLMVQSLAACTLEQRTMHQCLTWQKCSKTLCNSIAVANTSRRFHAAPCMPPEGAAHAVEGKIHTEQRRTGKKEGIRWGGVTGQEGGGMGVGKWTDLAQEGAGSMAVVCITS